MKGKFCFITLFTVILLLLSSSAWGQDEDYPKVEVFGGFSWVEIDVEGGEDERLNGWQASISGNFHENIGLSFNSGGQYQSLSGIGVQLYEFLVGPRFTLRIDEGTLFAHALVGVNQARVSGLGTFPLPGVGDTLSETAFAVGFGGGADINVSDWGAFRMVQIDYIADRLSDEWSWNYRAGVGFVLKFGN